MMNFDTLDELANKLSNALPASLKEAKNDLKENFKVILQATLAKMNLVTREEFDKQTALLRKAQEKLTALEKKISKP